MPSTRVTIRTYGRAIFGIVFLSAVVAAALAAACFTMNVEDQKAPDMAVGAGTLCLWIALLIAWYMKDLAVSLSIDETGFTIRTLVGGHRSIPWRAVQSIRGPDATNTRARSVYLIQHTDGTFRLVLPYREKTSCAVLALVHRYWADEHGISPYARESPEDLRAWARRWTRVSALASLACLLLILTGKLLGLLAVQWTWAMVFLGPAVTQAVALLLSGELYLGAWLMHRDRKLNDLRGNLDAQCELLDGTVRAAAWRRYWAHHPRGPLAVFLLSMLALGGFYAVLYWMVLPYGLPKHLPMLVLPAVMVIGMDVLFVLIQYSEHRTYVKNYRKAHKEEADATE